MWLNKYFCILLSVLQKLFVIRYFIIWGSPGGAMDREPANAGDLRDLGLIPGSGRSPGGHDNPLQYSCWENSMDSAAWQAIVYRVTKSWTRLRQLSMCVLLFFFCIGFQIY